MTLNTLRITCLATGVPVLLPGGLFPHSGLTWAAWTDPASAAPLPFQWRYPWLDTAVPPKEVPTDTLHWREWCELRAFVGRSEPTFVSKLINRGVPLMADTTVTAGPGTPEMTSLRAELFLHPWTVSAAVTLTLQLPPGSDAAAAASAASALRETAVLEAADVGSSELFTPGGLADLLVERCVTTAGTQLDPAFGLPGAVVATVIDGDPGPVADARPVPQNAQFCAALHELAGDPDGGGPVFWHKTYSTGNPYCDETRVVNVLRTGVSQWFHDAIAKLPKLPENYNTARHRRAVLRMIVLRSLHVLLERPSGPSPPWLGLTVEELKQLLVRLYAPSKHYPDFLAQAYLDLHQLKELFGNPTPNVRAVCPEAAIVPP